MKIKLKKIKKKFDIYLKKTIMHFRCHARQQKVTERYKRSLKISTDNLCGPSKEGKKKDVEKGEPEGLRKANL